MRITLWVLAIIQVVLGAFVLVQCSIGHSGLWYFCDDMAKLSASADIARWAEANGSLPIPSREAIFQSGQMYSGNRLSQLMVVVPAVCLVQALVCVVLAIRMQRPVVHSA
jgi:hypothetical protein